MTSVPARRLLGTVTVTVLPLLLMAVTAPEYCVTPMVCGAKFGTSVNCWNCIAKIMSRWAPHESIRRLSLSSPQLKRPVSTGSPGEIVPSSVRAALMRSVDVWRAGISLFCPVWAGEPIPRWVQSCDLQAEVQASPWPAPPFLLFHHSRSLGIPHSWDRPLSGTAGACTAEWCPQAYHP